MSRGTRWYPAKVALMTTACIQNPLLLGSEIDWKRPLPPSFITESRTLPCKTDRKTRVSWKWEGLVIDRAHGRRRGQIQTARLNSSTHFAIVILLEGTVSRLAAPGSCALSSVQHRNLSGAAYFQRPSQILPCLSKGWAESGGRGDYHPIQSPRRSHTHI